MKYDKELRKFETYLKGRARPGTVRVYIYALRAFLSGMNGNKPSRDTAQTYIDNLTIAGKSASTVATRAHAIMRWFKWRGERIYLDCPTIRMNEPKYLTMPQFAKVLAGCTTALEKVLVTVLFDTAVRISELMGLETEGIDWTRGFISVIRKGGRREEVNISAKALEVLDEWMTARESKSKRVFMDLEYYDAWVAIRNVGKRVGIDLHPHIFRHTRAVQMLLNGAALHDVQGHLGHRSITTTADIYGRFRAAELKARVPAW